MKSAFYVALFTRAWIEMATKSFMPLLQMVALFTRAWIEMDDMTFLKKDYKSPSSRGRGLKWEHVWQANIMFAVALFTRAWIEIVRLSGVL